MEDGTVIQRYSQNSYYSNTLRSDWSFPVDVRVAYKFDTMGGKLKWEIYGGAQDIYLVEFDGPQTRTVYVEVYGEG